MRVSTFMRTKGFRHRVLSLPVEVWRALMETPPLWHATIEWTWSGGTPPQFNNILLGWLTSLRTCLFLSAHSMKIATFLLSPPCKGSSLKLPPILSPQDTIVLA